MPEYTPVPTTTRQYSEMPPVPPHAETHDADGVDPVLGQIRLLGSQTLSTEITNTTATAADTGLTLTVLARGGELEIEVVGARQATDVAANGVSLISKAVIDSTSLVEYEEGIALNAAVTVASITVAAALRWYTTPLPGSHTIKIQFRLNVATGTATAYYAPGSVPVRLNITERVPLRRA